MVKKRVQLVLKTRWEARTLQMVLQVVRTMKMKNPLLLEVLYKIIRPQMSKKKPLQPLIKHLMNKIRISSIWSINKLEEISKSTWIRKESVKFVRWSQIAAKKCKEPKNSSSSIRWLWSWALIWRRNEEIRWIILIEKRIENRWEYLFFTD